MIKYILIAIIGYLLGSISVAVMLTKGKYGSDIRNQGSGNAGATNVARVFGMRAGLITLLGDMAKTALSGLAGVLIAGETGLAVACGACLIGHCWPVWFGFRGGKGVSVSGCIALLLDWRLFLILVAWFFLMFLLSHRVSVCSVTAALVYPIAYWLLNPGFSAGLVVCCMITVVVIFLHRGNIRRLLRGEEARFHPKSKS